MLERVRAIWIEGVLEGSLHQLTLITLGLQEQSDAVVYPLHMVMHEYAQADKMLPSGTHITQVYNTVGKELLILGEPGSGKTTVLLELTRDLLERAGADKNHPIPVVFNLSSWAMKRQPITEWLVEELHRVYLSTSEGWSGMAS